MSAAPGALERKGRKRPALPPAARLAVPDFARGRLLRIERLERQRHAFDLWVSGYTTSEIGEALGGVNANEVQNLLTNYRRFWTEYCAQDAEEHVAETAARLDRTERELWAIFERSQIRTKRRKKRTKVKSGAVDGYGEPLIPGDSEVERLDEEIIEKPIGDAGILAHITRVQYMRMRLFGMLDKEGEEKGRGKNLLDVDDLFRADTRETSNAERDEFLASPDGQPSDGSRQLRSVGTGSDDNSDLDILEAAERGETIDADISGESGKSVEQIAAERKDRKNQRRTLAEIEKRASKGIADTAEELLGVPPTNANGGTNGNGSDDDEEDIGF